MNSTTISTAPLFCFDKINRVSDNGLLTVPYQIPTKIEDSKILGSNTISNQQSDDYFDLCLGMIGVPQQQQQSQQSQQSNYDDQSLFVQQQQQQQQQFNQITNNFDSASFVNQQVQFETTSNNASPPESPIQAAATTNVVYNLQNTANSPAAFSNFLEDLGSSPSVSSPSVFSIPSQYIPNYGIVLNANNKNILPPQAWTTPIANNNNNIIVNSNQQGMNLQFHLGKQMNNNNNNNNNQKPSFNTLNTNGLQMSQFGTVMGLDKTLIPVQQQQQQLQQIQVKSQPTIINSNFSPNQYHVHSDDSSPPISPNSSEYSNTHWETGLSPDSLQKQHELNPPTVIRSGVVFFEPYMANEVGRHRACWNLIDPMHRNYYQPIQFKLPSESNPLPMGSNLADFAAQQLLDQQFFNNRYEGYRIYIHPAIGYSGNAKRFKQFPEPNEKALILDGNVYDGHLNPIYNCKICTEYYQTKSYFSANPHAKGKILLIKNNILTRVKDGGFVLHLKPMCCSGHNAHIPLYFHFTLTDPATNEVVLQSLVNVNVKQWKKSVQNKNKKQKVESM